MTTGWRRCSRVGWLSRVAESVIALDVGEARIGVARGEVGSSFAFGRGYIVRRNLAFDVAAVRERLVAENAARVVVGLPRRSDGGDSAQTKAVRDFAAALQAAGLEVVFEDERFTTQLASRKLVSSGLRKKKRQEKGLLDEAAAVLILETYLRKAAQT